MKINLFYLANTTKYGGWITYTAHLARALKQEGHAVTLFCITSKTLDKLKPWAYGLSYQAIRLEDAIKLTAKTPTLITAVRHEQFADTIALLRAGAALTVHDPSQWKNHSTTLHTIQQAGTIIGIRPSMQQHIRRAVIIPHPYVTSRPPLGKQPWKERTNWAISVSRICFDKHTDWMLEANRKLPEELRINIRGFETRQYGRAQLVPRFSEYIQSKGHFDRQDPNAAVKLCADYKFMVDLSSIEGDGGGTQYTFLEGMDAGCICVLNQAWILPDGEMQPGNNCLTVVSPDHLAMLFTSLAKNPDKLTAKISRLIAGNRAILAAHAPENVVPLYVKTLMNPGRRLTLV